MEKNGNGMLKDEQAWLRRLALGLVGEEAADDVVQETLIRAWQAEHNEQAINRSWLAKVARNSAFMHLRSKQRRNKREESFAATKATLAFQGDYQFPRVMEDVSNALSALEEPYRSTLKLRYINELSSTDIARRQKTSASTVRSRIKHGLECLRSHLDSRYKSRSGWLLAITPKIKLTKPPLAPLSLVSSLPKALTNTKTIAALIAAGLIGVWTSDQREIESTGNLQERTIASMSTNSSASFRVVTPRFMQTVSLDRIANTVAQVQKDARSAKRAKQHEHSKKMITKSLIPVPEMSPFDPRTLSKQVGEIIPLIKECHEEVLERDPLFEGKAFVNLSIVADKDVGAVVTSSTYDRKKSTLVDEEFEECIQETLYALELNTPRQDWGHMDFQLPIVLTNTNKINL